MAFVGCGNLEAAVRYEQDAHRLGNSIAGALEAYGAGNIKAKRPSSAMRSHLRNHPLGSQGQRGVHHAGLSAPYGSAAPSADAPATEAPPEAEDPPCRHLRTRTEDDVAREKSRPCMEEPCPILAGPPAQSLRARSKTGRARAGEGGAPIPREPQSLPNQPRFDNVRRRVRPCSTS